MNISPVLRVILAVGLSATVAIASAQRPELTVHHVGEYAAIPWQKPGASIKAGSRADRVKDLNFSVASVNLGDDMSDGFYKGWASQIELAAATGNVLLPRVYFWDGNDRFQGPMRDIEVYWRRMDEFLSRMDLSLLPGIVLAEENVHYGGRPAVLTELYRRIKSKYDIPVWQWWSPMRAVPGSGGWIPSDGWVVDPYFMSKRAFRRHVRKYLIAGVPLVVMPWAAQMDLSKTLSPKQWQANNDQLDVAVEYNLPVAFFWIYGTGCHFGGSRGEPKTELDRINHWVWDYIRRVRKLPADYTGLPSADYAEGDILEIGPNRHGKLVYSDNFRRSRCVDDATMTGCRDLVMDGKTLSARGFRGRPLDASLTYHFAGDFAVSCPTVSLTAYTVKALEGRLEVALSADGKRWTHQKAGTGKLKGKLKEEIVCSPRGDQEFAALREFWVRIQLSGKPGTRQAPPVQIDDLRIEANVLPRKGTAVTLKALPEDDAQLFYEDDFKTEKYRFTTARSDDHRLEWSEGRIAVRMRPGGSKPTLIWKLRAEKPVKDIVVKVYGRANTGNLGTTHYLDVSTDGKNWSHNVNTAGRKYNVNGWSTDGLTIDLSGDPRFRGVTEFYVRLRMRAISYKKVHPA